MINLDNHKFFEYNTKMDVVPLSIAKKALEEIKEKYEKRKIISKEA